MKDSGDAIDEIANLDQGRILQVRFGRFLPVYFKAVGRHNRLFARRLVLTSWVRCSQDVSHLDLEADSRFERATWPLRVLAGRASPKCLRLALRKLVTSSTRPWP